jgi:glutamate transport system permease protein
MTAPMLGEALGPRAKRRIWIASVAAAGVLAIVLGLMFKQLDDSGQFASRLWEPFTDSRVIEYLWGGLLNTLKAAGAAMGLAMVFGALLALGRLTRNRFVRWPAVAYIEFFRAVPLILLIFFCGIGLPQYGIRFPVFWFLVIALVVYNSAVLAEIFRAGILSLDRGQSEAAFAIGLGYWSTMRFVIVPQAARRMVPAIVSQLVTLLKDTALGYIITYEELLRRSEQTGTYYGNTLQALTIAAIVFIVVNFSLSRLARRLEYRQRRRLGAGGMRVAGAAEDLAAVSAQVQP